jgi:hypothetical protein
MRAAVALAAMVMTCNVCSAADATERLPIAGWLERARITPGGLVLDAKLDSGASRSSLHATNIQRFQRDGSEWLAFDLETGEGRPLRMERPLKRIARIRSAPGAEEERPVVTLGICVGNVYRVTEVNLVDRSGLAKPLLIGRSFLRGRLLVDLKNRYLLEPTCKGKTLREN